MQYAWEPRQPVRRSTTPKWVWLLVGCGGAAGLGVIAMCAGLVVLTGGNEGGVRYANNMEDYALRYIEEHRLLEPGEQIVAYYDNTVDLDATDSTILTDRRLVYHYAGNTTAIALADITDIRTSNEGILGDMIYVTGSDGTLMHITIAPLNGSEGFISALQAQRDAARSGGSTPAPLPPYL